jgi:septal ring factor EnvC (AmiA/AmiB activator)
VTDGAAVFISPAGRLGTSVSSERFKDDIHDMGIASGALFDLQPVTYHYKPEIDPRGIPQFGLVAEVVEKVAPSLVVHDLDGKPYSVRYEQVNAMLLNEFLKESKELGEQRAALDRLNVSIAQHQRESADTKARRQRALEAANARDGAEIESLATALQQREALIRKVSEELTKAKANVAPEPVVNSR